MCAQYYGTYEILRSFFVRLKPAFNRRQGSCEWASLFDIFRHNAQKDGVIIMRMMHCF